MYNLTQLFNANSSLMLYEYANDSTGGVLSGLFAIGLFVVMLMIMKKYDFVDALLASSFIAFVISEFMAFAKLLNFWYPLSFLILTALTALYGAMSKR